MRHMRACMCVHVCGWVRVGSLLLCLCMCARAVCVAFCVVVRACVRACVSETLYAHEPYGRLPHSRSITIAGNVKLATTIAMYNIFIWAENYSIGKFVGIFLTVGGALLYSYVSHREGLTPRSIKAT